MVQKQVMAKNHIFENIIIGGGPAGLTAGLYLSRSRINTILLEKALSGGQANLTELIENYPGFPEGIFGPDLMQRFERQAKKFGLQIVNSTVLEIAQDQQSDKVIFQVRTVEDIFY